MPTFTETILYLTIWTLSGAGLFFSVRAALRRLHPTKKSLIKTHPPAESLIMGDGPGANDHEKSC